MNAIDALLGEHAAIKSFLTYLERDPSNTMLLKALEEFLVSHKTIEEDLFYTDGVSNVLNPDEIKEMLSEHDQIEKLLKKTLDTDSKVLRNTRISEFAKVLKSHLLDEEIRIFPKIVSKISNESQNELERRWLKFRKIGK